MKARYLLDTNIVIYLRTKRYQTALAHFHALQHGEAVISVITHGELIYGACKSSYPDRGLSLLEQWVRLIPVAPLAELTANHYGTLRADLEKRGEIISNNDLWIASHALASGLTLVTNNEREFRRVPDLKLENWTV
jgi:tRNA(fMet)-specific endonuclease VapC